MPSFSFRPTAADLIAANRAFFAEQLRRWRTRRVLLIGCAVCALLAQAAVWHTGWRWALIAAAAGAGYWALILAVILGLSYLLIPRRSRRIYAQQKALHDEVRMDWSADGIAIESSRGSGRLAWTDFVRVAEGRGAIVVLQSDALFNFIPKRALSPADAAALLTAARAVREDG